MSSSVTVTPNSRNSAGAASMIRCRVAVPFGVRLAVLALMSLLRQFLDSLVHFIGDTVASDRSRPAKGEPPMPARLQASSIHGGDALRRRRPERGLTGDNDSHSRSVRRNG